MCVCRRRNFALLSAMTPEQGTDKIDSELQDQQDAMVELQGNIAENKEAGEELKKSLEHLETVTEKIEKENG
jgi:hypothetical protein